MDRDGESLNRQKRLSSVRPELMLSALKLKPPSESCSPQSYEWGWRSVETGMNKETDGIRERWPDRKVKGYVEIDG